MQLSPTLRPLVPSAHWLATGAVYAAALVVIGAFMILGIDETRGLLFG